jgi:formate dehydrogenase subunit gamma
MSTASDAAHIDRFCKTTRWFHWTFALSFLALAATGSPLFLREQLALGEETAHTLIEAHEIIAVVFLSAPWLVAASGDTRRWLADLTEILPIGRDDLAWLRAQLTPWRQCELPGQGKLNAGQKLNALLVLGLSSVLTVTGLHLWREPGAFVALALHVAGFAIWIPVFAGHLFLALVNVRTRPALRGMILGTVRRDWARHHHRRWVDSVEQE